MLNPAISRTDEPLDLRRLQQFLCVAEAAGFSRAAERLHLSQQALSSSVARLETQLGVRLFDRTSRQVRLTPAGEALRDGATALLAAGQVLTRQVRDIATAQQRPFVVAHTPAVTAEEVHELLAPIRSDRVDVSVTVIQMFPGELEPALLDGRIDLALRRGVATSPRVTTAVIGYHRLRIAVSRRHRLAERTSIDIRELREERIVVWAPPGWSFYTDFVLGACRRAGFEPALVVDRIQGTTPVTAVLDYPEAVAFVTGHAGPTLGGAVQVIDLDDAPLAPIQALWLPHSRSAIRDLLTTRGGSGEFGTEDVRHTAPIARPAPAMASAADPVTADNGTVTTGSSASDPRPNGPESYPPAT